MSEWKECKLGDVVELFDGPHATPKKAITGPVFLGISSLNKGKLEASQFEYISEEDFVRWTKRVAPKQGDIVFSYETRLGEAAIIPEAFRCCLGRRLGLMRANEKKVVSYFLLYYYLGPLFQRVIHERTIHGTTVDRLPLIDMPKFPVFLPPLPEQCAIAAVLSSLDDKIDLLNRQNKTLEAMAATLFRQWFIEEADEGWEIGKLPDEFDFTMGQSPEGFSFNENGIGIPMFQGNADFGFRFPSERVYTTAPIRFAEPMDVLISVRAPVGAQNMALKRCCIGRGVAAFRYKKEKTYYTYTFFKLRSLITEIKQFNNEGTIFGSIGKTDFEGIDIIIPPNSLIAYFENSVGPINNKVIKNCYQIRTLQNLRDTLLPKLMSGEVRVAL